jgi:hypothetical protein
MTSTPSRPHPPSGTLISPRLSETSEITVYPSSVSLRVCIKNKRFFCYTSKKKLFFFASY